MRNSILKNQEQEKDAHYYLHYSILHCTRVLATELRKEGEEGRRGEKREEEEVGRKEGRKAGKYQG